MKRLQISGVDIFFLTLLFVIFIAIVSAPNMLISSSNDNIKKVSNQIESRQNIANISSDLVISTNLTTLSQEVITTPKEANNNLDYNILLVLLSLTTLVSIFISFWLYRWRKVATSDKEIVVPEVFAQQLQSIYASVNYSNSQLENTIKKQSDVVNQQSNEVNKSSISLSSLRENIKEMIEVHMKLQSTLDQKEDEINRYKEGYDAKIFHNFLLRFTIVDQSINDYIGDNGISEEVRDVLKNIQEVMEDALAECGVESFSPEIGGDYRSAEGVADNPKKVDTDDESKHFAIAEVFGEGYRRKIDDGGYKIITQAKVSVYIYKNPEQGVSNKE
jgi:molecular chaperone GrpE (heat shock protein)